ncbi:MAG TPA: HNH endonuclease, partial [Aeromicrobium sp.]|nr:HNH endonuclease [Aeromicrobium sp.]
MDGSVLVLNASYEPLQRVSLRHAIKMLVREVAVVEEEAGGTFGPFPVPKVLRLVRYVVTRWLHRRPQL